MNLLALDTSTSHAAVAVSTSGGRVQTIRPDPAQRHGRNLLPAIRDLLGEAGVSLADLDAIAVGLGPGSYTGLRIGVTAAKTLAYATGKPLVGLDSLEAIAGNAPAEALRVSVVADAQRGDLYVADFTRHEPGAPLSRVAPTRIASLAEWSAGLVPLTFVLGPARARVAEALAFPSAPDADWPDGVKLLELARAVWDSGRRDEVLFLEPTYLRRSAAEDQWDAAPRGPAR